MAYQPITIPQSVIGSVFTYPQANQSVSGVVGASVFGQLPAGTAPIGSVAALQGTNPWITNVNHSVATVIIGGSIAATFTPPANQSVSGTVNTLPLGTIVTSLVSTVPSSVIVGVSIFGQLPAGSAPIGSVAALQGTNPWITNINHSIAAVIIGGSVATATTNSSVMLLNGANAIGSVTALQGTNPWIETFSNSSILAVPVGSVVTLNQGSSILAVPVGSVVTVWQSPSIVGTYAEDAAHTSADKGLFNMGVRNDTLASITSADLDYSPHAVGQSGETIVAVAPLTKGIQGTADLRVVQGASVVVIAAQGASVFSYIRAAQIANMGSASVLVTFGGGLGSVLSYSIAPAGGGSNIKFDPWLKTGENSAFTASISGVASVLVSAQGFIAKA